MGAWRSSFRYIDPKTYKDIAQNLAERRTDRENEMRTIIAKLQTILSQAGVHADITGRPKHIYSIYRKMYRKGIPFDMVFDVRGVRILVLMSKIAMER